MRTLEPEGLTPVAKEIIRLKPASILELGIGYGVYGAIARHYLDVDEGNLTFPTWTHIICGVSRDAGLKTSMWDNYTVV